MVRAYHLWGIAENPRRCGERKAIVEAEDWQGPRFQTCMNAAVVKAFPEISRRRVRFSACPRAWAMAEGDSLTPAERGSRSATP
jgi:hypothetical protein